MRLSVMNLLESRRAKPRQIGYGPHDDLTPRVASAGLSTTAVGPWNGTIYVSTGVAWQL